ncbi:hypothetical protein ACIRQY_33985 [Streptomyces sp. NPDC101490]|uniref:hypothetical protein n=1 Tax=Streptomyces sp. NPDC101490 TaxID=3366143 RepID=UPI00380121A4
MPATSRRPQASPDARLRLGTIETLTEALGAIRPEVRHTLAAVTAATSTARRRVGLPVEPEPEPEPGTAPGRTARGRQAGR